jgi:hypothetical protein
VKVLPNCFHLLGILDVCRVAETPMTLAVQVADPKPVMLALIEGGAHLDFRNSKSYTALHCAARTCSQKAIKVDLLNSR